MTTYINLPDLVEKTADKKLHVVITEIGEWTKAKNDNLYRKVTFSLPATGKTHTESVFENSFKFGFLCEEDEEIMDLINKHFEVTINKKGFAEYKMLRASSESVEVPATQSSYKQVVGERAAGAALTEAEQKEKEKWDKIALSKIIHEFMKTVYAQGVQADKCAEVAENLTKAQYASVDKLWEGFKTNELTQAK